MAHQVTQTHFYYYNHPQHASSPSAPPEPPSSTTVAPQDTLRQPQRTPQPQTTSVPVQAQSQPQRQQTTMTTTAPVQQQQQQQRSPPQQHQPPPPLPAQPSQTNPGPRVATGDWTKDLVQLAKTAELKKHALTLQLHTAHILSAHAMLDQKNKAIQDVREQKNRLESERARLLEQLRQINQDRDSADLLLSNLSKECDTLKTQIHTLQEGEYAAAKRDVDKLRVELGQPPLPSLQNTLDERSNHYLTDRRLASSHTPIAAHATGGSSSSSATPSPTGIVRPVPPSSSSSLDPNNTNGNGEPPMKRPRGRPKGSKNRSKD